MSIFVRNQIIEIINEIDVEFQSVNTKTNSADVPTLGISAKELENNKLRWHGPKWLLQGRNEWPQESSRVVKENTESVSEEIIFIITLSLSLNYYYLSSKRQLNGKQKQSQINPKIHQGGIIILYGIFINADLPEDSKLPILLPR